MDAPAFRIRPPVTLGLPLAAGVVLTVERLAESVRALALALVPVGVAGLVRGAIRPGERHLSPRFGAEYDAYRARVRRWL